MSTLGNRDEHLDIRVSAEELKQILRRVPADTGRADWARALLLGTPVQRGRVMRVRVSRDTTPYKERLRQDALLSIAATLGHLAGSSLGAETQRDIQELLGLVRRKLIKKEPSC